MLLCVVSAIAAIGAGFPQVARGGESRPVAHGDTATDVRRVVNIVNFVRALDPRSPKAEYLRALREEVALNLKYGFENTILLQYDALVDAEMMAEARTEMERMASLPRRALDPPGSPRAPSTRRRRRSGSPWCPRPEPLIWIRESR